MGSWAPVYLRLDGRRTVVFGGGTVATRRAVALASMGAHVDVYSLEFSGELERLAGDGRIRLHRLDLSRLSDERLEELARGAVIVVAATDDMGLNRRLLRAARRAGALVNYPPRGVEGDLIFPFKASTSYGLHVAVTSLGRTGIAARRALERIIGFLEGDDYVRGLYLVMSRFKEWLMTVEDSPKRRLPVYFEVDADPIFQRLVEEGRLDEALERAKALALQLLGKAQQPP